MGVETRFSGLEWIEMLGADEIAAVLLMIEKYNLERVILGDKEAEKKLRTRLNDYIHDLP